MKLVLEPTEHFFMAGDVMVRAWTGTADGAKVVALVAGIRSERDLDGLVSIPSPDGESARRWAAEVFSHRYDDEGA